MFSTGGGEAWELLNEVISGFGKTVVHTIVKNGL